MKAFTRYAFFALVLSGGAWAEIYETTDSEGNKVFTDTPTQEAEVVDLPEANIADAVKPAPRPEPEAAPAPGAATPAQPQQKDDGVYIIGDTHNERLEEKIARERRQEVLDAESPHEVLDAEAPREVLDAEQRHEAIEGVPHRAPHPVRHHR